MMQWIAAATALSAVLAVSTVRAEVPYYGLGQAHYQECIKLGKQVMSTQRMSPDGPAHKQAYSAFNQRCGLAVMMPYIKKYNLSGDENPPFSPLGWSEL